MIIKWDVYLSIHWLNSISISILINLLLFFSLKIKTQIKGNPRDRTLIIIINYRKYFYCKMKKLLHRLRSVLGYPPSPIPMHTLTHKLICLFKFPDTYVSFLPYFLCVPCTFHCDFLAQTPTKSSLFPC